MIPFHRIYSWLFKSFRISGETELIERLITDGYSKIMIVKRSWIFFLFVIWIPIVILGLSGMSIWIALYSLSIPYIQYTIIGWNILMSTIFIVSTFNYIRHFREIQSSAIVSENTEELKKDLSRGDTYFIRFFNASITNQFILFTTLVTELFLVFIFREQLWDHFWVLTTDTLIIIWEIIFLKMFRKRMMDLEMDYNVVVPWKIYFVNQSGVLSSIQTIESDKIKTVRSAFPSKIASFFNYGTVDILTEWDTQAMMGTMSMYYVTDPDWVVANIQSLLDEDKGKSGETRREANIKNQDTSKTTSLVKENMESSRRHTVDTRERIRDVLR